MERAFPQTDSRQSERQRERQGNVVDGSEQELKQHRDALLQMALAEDECPGGEGAKGRACVPPEYLVH